MTVIPFPVTSDTQRVTNNSEYFLHVTPKGSEIRYRKEPTLCPSIHVVIFEGHEYCATRSAECIDDAGHGFISPVPPPGRRWIRCDLVPDFIQQRLKKNRPLQVWSRKAKAVRHA